MDNEHDGLVSIIEMSHRQERICRLCLKVAENRFKEIDENMKQIFDILLLKLDLDITSDPTVCYDCAEVAKKCLNFKSICLDTERNILLFSISKKTAKHNIKVIYKERKQIETIFDENVDICRFCMTRLRRNNVASLDLLMKEATFEMLPLCMPEMDFNIIEEPMICATCRENFMDYFKFVSNSLYIDGTIRTYCIEVGSGSIGQVELRNIVSFLFKNILKYPDKCPQICEIKEKSNMFEDKEYLDHEAYSRLIKLEEDLDIKKEENEFEENYYKHLSEFRLGKYDMFPPNEFGKEAESNMIYLEIREFGTMNCTDQIDTQANIAENTSNHEGYLESNMNESSFMQINKHSVCKDITKHGENVKNDLITNTVASKRKRKNNIDGNTTYKCSFCTYETNQKSYLIRHMLVHKDTSELKMYKCSMCAYEAKRRDQLNRHVILIHKDVSEVKMYKCALCAYEGKQKRSLKTHMFVHKDASEVNMYQCSLCTYEAKHKSYLKRHMSVHKANAYKCALCDYEAKEEGYLKAHLLTHEGDPERKPNKCPFCIFETRLKSNLKSHVLVVHKDVSEVKMFSCSVCPYQAKRISYINKHMIVHKDVSEIKMHKCSLCAYQSRQQNGLKKHMLARHAPFHTTQGCPEDV